MRILIQTINFHPDLTGIAKIMGELAKGLAEEGHTMHVVTAPPYYPEWKIRTGYGGLRYRRERSADGRLTVWRCPLWVPRRPRGVTRLVHLASFALSSLPVLLAQVAWRPDVIMLVEPPLMCAPAVLLAARLSRARTWLNVQDFEVDAACALGILGGRRMRGLAYRVETMLMRRIDRISSISETMVARLCEKGVDPEKVRFLPNWVDIAGIREDRAGSAALRAQWGIRPDQLVALYSGNLGVKQGLELIAETARQMKSRAEIQFVICGSGAARRELERAAAGLPNLMLRDLVPAEQLNALLHLADIHLLPQRAGAADLCMPSKILYMLASSRPVVATAASDTELGQLVRRAGGVVLPPADPAALEQALVALAQDPERRRRAGETGREIVAAEFERVRVLRTLARELQELTGRPAVRTAAAGAGGPRA